MFYGEYKHTVDAKGRLFIPAKLREKLGEEFIFSRGLDNCICIYPMAEWERFTAKLEELPVAKERHVRRYFYAGAYEGSVDSQGRVTLSQNYRDIAKLEKDVVIVGNRSHLEVWSAEAWEAEQKFINNEEITNELIELGF
ncbi:MAG: division/cell wall cluster transcriptional repressor MraZ [Clostridia bacterium]|nr:division/cell wall cluster transcriptional repressor MraZ [Clostridia bacterium]MBR5277836.1 division/cell wall cluster transcriptional repressor MraZ [Clostridia bacterium]